MKHDCIQILGQALKKLIVEQSAYINGPECDFDSLAAQVILQTSGEVAIMSQDVFELATGGLELDEPIPYELTALGIGHGRVPLEPPPDTEPSGLGLEEPFVGDIGHQIPVIGMNYSRVDCSGPVNCGGGNKCDRHQDIS